MSSSADEPISVLIVDDHEITRVGLVVTLRSSKRLSVVGEATNGAEAIEQAENFRPNVVLMDLSMPVIDGISATRTIKEKFPQTKVMILTNQDTIPEIIAAMAAGADGYCLKTVGKSQLEAAIAAIFEGGVWLDHKIAKQLLQLNQNKEVPLAAEPEKNQFNLSQREMDVLTLLVKGLSNQQMAETLRVGIETIKTHMRHIMGKMAVSDRTQVAIKAVRGGLVPPPDLENPF